MKPTFDIHCAPFWPQNFTLEVKKKGKIKRHLFSGENKVPKPSKTFETQYKNLSSDLNNLKQIWISR